MLDFGFSEVVVTSMIALVVLGPKRLPGVMRRIGNWMGRARVMARQLTDQLEREINADEILQQAKKSPPLPPDVPATAATAATPAAPAAPAMSVPIGATATATPVATPDATPAATDEATPAAKPAP